MYLNFSMLGVLFSLTAFATTTTHYQCTLSNDETSEVLVSKSVPSSELKVDLKYEKIGIYVDRLRGIGFRSASLVYIDGNDIRRVYFMENISSEATRPQRLKLICGDRYTSICMVSSKSIRKYFAKR